MQERPIPQSLAHNRGIELRSMSVNYTDLGRAVSDDDKVPPGYIYNDVASEQAPATPSNAFSGAISRTMGTPPAD